MGLVRLSKPFNHDGREYTEFNLDYDGATGVTMRQAEKLARKKYGLTDMYLPVSSTYRGIFASLLLKIPAETLEGLPLPDYQALTDDVLIFFGGAASEDMTEPEVSASTPETIS